MSSNHVFADNIATSYGGLVGWRQADFKSDHGNYPIWYKITNGTVISTPSDLPAKTLFFMIKAPYDGQLIVQLPRSTIDSKNQDIDQPYFVAVRGTTGLSKINTTETSDDYIRTLKIDFTKYTSEIEIVGTFFVEDHQPVTKNPSKLSSPLEQFKSGISPLNVKCSTNYVPVIKAEDSSPACVKPDTAQNLVKRGWETQGEKSYHVYFPGLPPPIIDTRIAKIVSGTQEAQSIVRYYVGMPHYLPPGYSMQVILADDASKSVKILASNFPVTQNTTSVEFMDKGGIMIYMEPITQAFNQTSWTAGWIKQTPGSSTIKINGYNGVINGITIGNRFGEEIDIPAEIIIFPDNAMVEISGFLYPDELTKIAENMLAK
ncbi:MAG TPA: hypothetical protein VGR54_09455 [Nitrosopumilaceae archaeon]|nr:hypothetical protein [Nitrosopumilaceae archaeon]